jgi:hypothetical protein
LQKKDRKIPALKALREDDYKAWAFSVSFKVKGQIGSNKTQGYTG